MPFDKRFHNCLLLEVFLPAISNLTKPQICFLGPGLSRRRTTPKAFAAPTLRPMRRKIRGIQTYPKDESLNQLWSQFTNAHSSFGTLLWPTVRIEHWRNTTLSTWWRLRTSTLFIHVRWQPSFTGRQYRSLVVSNLIWMDSTTSCHFFVRNQCWKPMSSIPFFPNIFPFTIPQIQWTSSTSVAGHTIG